MTLLDRVRRGYVHRRRVRVLADEIARLSSPSATVLDVGCGDGLLAREIKLWRADVEVAGTDVLVRSLTHVAVGLFDGRSIPHGGGAFESVMMVDVLHHTGDPLVLLREAMRAARREVILKDHTMDTRLLGAILGLMDDAGNERHGVRIVYNYWSTERWRRAFSEVGLDVADARSCSVPLAGQPSLRPRPALRRKADPAGPPLEW